MGNDAMICRACVPPGPSVEPPLAMRLNNSITAASRKELTRAVEVGGVEQVVDLADVAHASAVCVTCHAVVSAR